MRSYSRTDDIISVGGMTAPVADSFVGSVFQCHVPGGDRDYGSSQHFHFLNVDVLAFHIRFSHVYDTFHIH